MSDVKKNQEQTKPEAGQRLALIRHSVSHVMAQAVTRLFPGTKVAIGPSIENGFYYDFQFPPLPDGKAPITAGDLPAIEAEMKKIIDSKQDFVQLELSRDEALKRFVDEPFKTELINELPADEVITIYENRDAGGAVQWADFCRGPHVANTREINSAAFKLMSIAGAYWRGDEKRDMLTRLYGTAWENPKDLKAHLAFLEEVEKRDHRRLGKEMDLYSIHEDAGAGLIYWHPNGGRMRVAVENFWRTLHYRNGYEILYTPHIGKSWLWETSGHLGFYKGNMYSPMEIDNQDYIIKPMNCPFHIMIYKNKQRSYRELPLRWAELGTVYRYERSGVLHGLLRVRGFTQDDAHIFCTPEQMDGEIQEVLRFSLQLWKVFGFTDIKAYLATRPAESVGEQFRWDNALESLRKAVTAEGLNYEIDEGGGAFYGPKIDLKIKDALGREWQMTTIQFDFNEPERFDMTFVDADGQHKRPYMIHRALLGSLERFFGVLIEHFGGAFPVWIAPEQIAVIPVAEGFNEYAKKVAAELKARDLRVTAELDDSRLNAKIRNCQNRKIPYMLVVGEREANEGTVSIRRRDGKQPDSPAMKVAEFADYVVKKVDTQDLEL
ncbi:threonine--tRNA ligase [Treponema primitia ZAS-2]|uniref:Threonine--tRNA ligase n=1 Tax=Treponema primitia (strain ATCC BAA-887 / DSM 12427 / ZAS-2) TaxID=545694 RepID=F5YMI3_TREPZ|nr:threonine--tRNA ligase [Treponema primitia]AEF83802.1 threonine--tRNA ligase [Treponema primitia ZAS-2]